MRGQEKFSGGTSRDHENTILIASHDGHVALGTATSRGPSPLSTLRFIRVEARDSSFGRVQGIGNNLVLSLCTERVLVCKWRQ